MCSARTRPIRLITEADNKVVNLLCSFVSLLFPSASFSGSEPDNQIRRPVHQQRPMGNWPLLMRLDRPCNQRPISVPFRGPFSYSHSFTLRDMYAILKNGTVFGANEKGRERQCQYDHHHQTMRLLLLPEQPSSTKLTANLICSVINAVK